MSVPSGYTPLETVTFGAIQERGPSNTPGEVTVLQPISTSSPITAPNFVRPVSIRSPAARRTMFVTRRLFSSSVLSRGSASLHTPPRFARPQMLSPRRRNAPAVRAYRLKALFFCVRRMTTLLGLTAAGPREYLRAMPTSAPA